MILNISGRDGGARIDEGVEEKGSVAGLAHSNGTALESVASVDVDGAFFSSLTNPKLSRATMIEEVESFVKW